MEMLGFHSCIVTFYEFLVCVGLECYEAQIKMKLPYLFRSSIELEAISQRVVKKISLAT